MGKWGAEEAGEAGEAGEQGQHLQLNTPHSTLNTSSNYLFNRCLTPSAIFWPR
jgi:hypothetical protein